MCRVREKGMGSWSPKQSEQGATLEVLEEMTAKKSRAGACQEPMQRVSLLLRGLGTRIWTLDLHKRQPNSSTSDRWHPDTPSSPQCFPVVAKLSLLGRKGFLKGRELRSAKRPEGVSRGPCWAPHLR